MPKKKLEFEEFESILERVDLDKVAEEIAGTDGYLKDYDFDDAKRMVMVAAQRWLPRDLKDFILDGDSFEKRIETPMFKGFIDLRGEMTGYCKTFEIYKNNRFILDWKTARTGLDTRWKDRLIDSWQWRHYIDYEATLYKEEDTTASLFFYRGVNRQGETKEVPIIVPPRTVKESTDQFYGIRSMIEGLEDKRVWPRNMPFACQAYGQECHRYNDCVSGGMPYRRIAAIPKLSPTFMKEFLLCPEKGRRYILDKEDEIYDDEGTEDTQLGSAFHRGVAELWKQAFKIT